jgi:hypothetical protein
MVMETGLGVFMPVTGITVTVIEAGVAMTVGFGVEVCERTCVAPCNVENTAPVCVPSITGVPGVSLTPVQLTMPRKVRLVRKSID